MACPDPSDLDAYALGQSSAEVRARVEAHVDACPECTRVVVELIRIYGRSVEGSSAGGSLAYASTVPAQGAARAAPAIGQHVGRYRVLYALGEGGMGTVLAAHDPELDRTVALKLLHTAPGTPPEEQRARLAREARAMAKLAHPNVITVFDVGIDGSSGQLFVAMELVHGTTLTTWLREQPRGERQILEAFSAAGQGLAAAHDAGLVHRDFKPENVLVGADGRVRVGDFGLAKSPRAGAAQAPPQELDLTHTGAIVGTPAYMAPEQFLGQATDPRTDQFAFAVALFEALTGERPFVGNSLGELQKSVIAGRRSPAWQRLRHWQPAFFARALAREPDARFADMGAALAALVPAAPRTRRGPWVLLAALFTAGAVAGGLALTRPQEQPAASAAPTDPVEVSPAGLAPPPGHVAAEVGAVRKELQSIDRELAGFLPKLEPLQKRAEAAVGRARKTGYDPLVAEALVRVGRAELLVERPKRARAAHEEAVKLARASRHDQLLIEASVELVEIATQLSAPSSETESWVGLAEAEAKRSDDPAVKARLDLAIGRLRLGDGKASEAAEHFDRALALRAQRFGSDSREVAEVRRERARAARARGALAEAHTDATLALAFVKNDVILRGSRESSRYSLELAEVLLAQGKPADAAAELEPAITKAAEFGRLAGESLRLYDALARACAARNLRDDAQRAADAALSSFVIEVDGGALDYRDPSGEKRTAGAIDIAEQIKGRAQRPTDASALIESNAKAAATAVEGDEPRAISLLEDVLARANENPALVAGALGAIHHNLALLELRRGDLAAASRHVGESLAALAREVGTDHIRYGVALALEARILGKLGSPSAAARAEAANRVLDQRRVR